MSRDATKTKTTAAEPAAKTPARAKKRWKVVVGGASGEASQDHISADRLAEAASRPKPLPYRAELEGYFGTDLGGIATYDSDEVGALLQVEDAVAAVVGDKLLLRPDAPLSVVAHEVAHILQQRSSGAWPSPQAAEREALAVEARVAANRPVPPVSEGLFPGSIAFRRTGALDDQPVAAPPDHEAVREFAAGRQGEDTRGNEAGVAEESAPETASSEAGGLEAPDLGADIPDEPVPTFEPPAAPEIEVDEAAAAAAEEAGAALEGAEDTDDLVGSFKDAPPSVKAMHHDTVEGKSGELAAEEQASFEEEMPEFQAEMSGTDDLAEPAPVATPENTDAPLEEGVAPPLVEPEVDPTPDPGTANLNRSGDDLIAGVFQPGEAEGLGRAFSRVQTGDTEVETSAGERPEVPQEGATDPARVTDQDEAARENATASRQEATQAVLDGPGPEQVELQRMTEDFAMEARAASEIAEAEGPVEGAEEFRTKELDPEVTALFDQHHSDAMSESLGAAEEEVSTAVETRDTDRDTEVANAEAEKDRLNAEADENQRTEVTNRRQEVQDARQTAVDAQAEHLSDMEADAVTRRQEAEDEIDGEIADTESQIETDFTQAEEDAEAEVRAGEAEAEAEKERQEREAENQSWWDRATDWVVDQFNRLTEFINSVFDAVRAAVADIIDAVKDAALALIDLAASAITAAIEAFGEALRAAVNALLAEHFPAVAQALNDAIDSAVELATAAVDLIAEGLRTAVSAMLDALAAGLDAILAAYQAAVNAAFAIMRAALTGDWSELARLILEPILMALGIQPEAFYEMLAQAAEALDIIIDDPVGFLSNLVDAFVGGVRKFAGNLFTHLQAGIIGWLTGALGGDIQIPTEWNLMSVLELARQILGLTVDMLRRVAVRVLGEEAVERIEFFMGYVVELITGGFTALWERIVQDLGNLKDMVLETIKNFLLERIVMAAITWLASMFSPVGALVKLVMTIWNFLMFLKDQLARIIQVVQTVVATIYEIATGVLEPAMQGVENVLARLLPIAIDLLARLLGLGNVAGRVRRIIGDVRQRIEDALVRLINRVLSAFTGGRLGGGGSGEDDEEADSDTDLMRPVPFSGAGESHTLYIQEEGAGAVPMMRSTPTPVETWLRGLRGNGLRAIGDRQDPRWDDTVLDEKREAIRDPLERALGKEAVVDETSDTEAEREDNAPEGQNPAPSAQLQAEGEELAAIMTEILETLGIAGGSIATVFEADIGAMNSSIRSSFEQAIMPLLQPESEYLELTWDQLSQRVAGLSLPELWAKPAASSGIARTSLASEFEDAVKAIGEAKVGAEPFQETAATPDPLGHFFNHYLVRRLNDGAASRPIIVLLLSPQAGLGNEMAQSVRAVIEEAAERFASRGESPEPDFAVRDRISAGNFQQLLMAGAREFASGEAQFGPFFPEKDTNTAGAPHPEDPAPQTKSLHWFLTESPRAGANRGYLSNAIRRADAGNHEWILTSMASQVIEGTARALDSEQMIEPVSGLSKLIRFQHLVRTPTSDLMFKPDANPAPNHLGRQFGFVSAGHRASGKPYSDLTEQEVNQFYPSSGPAFGAQGRVIHAHTGGLKGAVQSGDNVIEVSFSAPSASWHTELRQRLEAPIADGILTNEEARTGLKEVVLDYFDGTIWRGQSQLEDVNGQRLNVYYRGGTWMSYNDLRGVAAGEETDTRAALEASIQQAIS